MSNEIKEMGEEVIGEVRGFLSKNKKKLTLLVIIYVLYVWLFKEN